MSQIIIMIIFRSCHMFLVVINLKDKFTKKSHSSVIDPTFRPYVKSGQVL